jgi:hypothetical protein
MPLLRSLARVRAHQCAPHRPRQHAVGGDTSSTVSITNQLFGISGPTLTGDRTMSCSVRLIVRSPDGGLPFRLGAFTLRSGSVLSRYGTAQRHLAHPGSSRGGWRSASLRLVLAKRSKRRMQ